MEPTVAPMLSVTPVSAVSADTLETLQNNAIFTENAAARPPGLFASLLQQLTVDEPLVAPEPVETTAVFPTTVSWFATEVLPADGKILPVNPATVAATTSVPVAAASDALLHAGAAPPPELRQPAAINAEAVTATVNSNQIVAAVPNLAIAAKPEPPQTRTAAKPLTPDSVVLPEPSRAETKLFTDSLPARPVIATPDILVERPVQPPQHPLTPAPVDGATALATATPATPQSAALTTTSQPTITLEHPVADPRWGESLGQRVIWMSENGMGRAQIRLNPPELGPLNVQVTVSNDEAKVAFNVQHGTTREMVEAALPRLREMFASQGIELTDATVSQHSPDQREQTNPGGTSESSTETDAPHLTGIGEAATGGISTSENLIDTYV